MFFFPKPSVVLPASVCDMIYQPYRFTRRRRRPPQGQLTDSTPITDARLTRDVTSLPVWKKWKKKETIFCFSSLLKVFVDGTKWKQTSIYWRAQFEENACGSDQDNRNVGQELPFNWASVLKSAWQQPPNLKHGSRPRQVSRAIF